MLNPTLVPESFALHAPEQLLRGSVRLRPHGQLLEHLPLRVVPPALEVDQVALLERPEAHQVAQRAGRGRTPARTPGPRSPCGPVFRCRVRCSSPRCRWGLMGCPAPARAGSREEDRWPRRWASRHGSRTSCGCRRIPRATQAERDTAGPGGGAAARQARDRPADARRRRARGAREREPIERATVDVAGGRGTVVARRRARADRRGAGARARRALPGPPRGRPVLRRARREAARRAGRHRVPLRPDARGAAARVARGAGRARDARVVAGGSAAPADPEVGRAPRPAARSCSRSVAAPPLGSSAGREAGHRRAPVTGTALVVASREEAGAGLGARQRAGPRARPTAARSPATAGRRATRRDCARPGSAQRAVTG